MKLVAYYSRGGENHFGGQKIYLEKGNTQKVAELIADKLGADTFKIEPLVPYSENYDECVREVVADFRNNARPELKENLDMLSNWQTKIEDAEVSLEMTVSPCRYRVH